MFRCALLEIDELAISIATNGSSHIAQLPIGYDEKTKRRYSIFVALDTLMGYGSTGKELIFCLLEADPETGDVEQIWDGQMTKRIISDASHRMAILSAVVETVRTLIDDVKPHIVEMTTYSAHLPPQALRKYGIIVSTLGDMGYFVGKADVWNGRHIWMMERL